MKRREAMGALAGSVLLAGCSGSESSETETDPTDTTPADLQVDALRVEPAGVEIGGSFSVVAEVSNHGGQTGRGEVWYAVSASEDSLTPVRSGSFVVDLEGGATETYSESYALESVGDYVATVDPDRTTDVRNTDHETTLSVSPKALEFGETFENYEGYRITSESVDIRESYEARSSISGEVETVEPEDYALFAFVQVRVRNDGDASSTVPTPRSFFARVDGSAYELGINPGMRRPDFRGDLEDAELFTAGEIPAGTERVGYLVFEVPETDREGFEAGWTSRYRPNQVVYWG